MAGARQRRVFQDGGQTWKTAQGTSPKMYRVSGESLSNL